jgi:hypothetical protein
MYKWYQLIWPFKQIGFWLARRRLARANAKWKSERWTEQYLNDPVDVLDQMQHDMDYGDK